MHPLLLPLLLLAVTVRPTIGDHRSKFLIPASEVTRLPKVDKALYPLSLQFHHTRYFGGCFTADWEHSNYSAIQPWVFNFDYLVSSCGVNWASPATPRSGGTCIYQWAADGNVNGTVYEDDRRPFSLKRDEKTVIIHVHCDYRHGKFFVENVLPLYEKQSDVGIVLHYGGGDRGANFYERLIGSPSVRRWVIEQLGGYELTALHPKVRLLPTGLCEREYDVEHAGTLVHALAHTLEGGDGSTAALGSKERRELLEAAVKNALPWSARKDRVLFCWSHDEARPSRSEWAAYARGELYHQQDSSGGVEAGCGKRCDDCHRLANFSSTHADLWRLYGEYKYVASPHGNGPDCGRTWEILLLGAVPVVEFFTGAAGYLDGLGEQALIAIKNVTEISAANISAWSLVHRRGVDRTKLTHEYWSRLSFEMDSPVPPRLRATANFTRHRQ